VTTLFAMSSKRTGKRRMCGIGRCPAAPGHKQGGPKGRGRHRWQVMPPTRKPCQKGGVQKVTVSIGVQNEFGKGLSLLNQRVGRLGGLKPTSRKGLASDPATIGIAETSNNSNRRVEENHNNDAAPVAKKSRMGTDGDLTGGVKKNRYEPSSGGRGSMRGQRGRQCFSPDATYRV